MKKLLALALTLALCLGLAAPALALDYGQEYAGYTTGSSQQYRDVPDTHWAFQSIATCSQRSWFNGYPDGTFRPEGLITREEAAKVFAVAMSLEIETNPTVTYTDTANNWAKAYIEATKPLFPNVANLQGTASFRPTQTITREETIYALVVAWGYGSKTKNADLSVLNMFSDTSSVSAGVKPYLAVAVSEGLVSGLPDGTIAAQKGLTRAEFATLLARALSHGYGDTKQEFQAPKITLDKYSATTDKASLTVTGTVTPADATVTLDGNDVRVSKGSFSVELELKVGVNSFTLTAENAYGTKDSKTISVERTDQLAISINSFEAKTEAEEVTLTGTVTPPAGVTLTVDGNEVPTTSTGAFNVTLPLEVGANVFEFSAKNTNGSTATKSVKITREFVAPTSEPTQEPEEPSSGSSSSVTEEPEKSDTVSSYAYKFVYNNSWERDPNNKECYLVNVVDENGNETKMRVTAAIRDKIAADSISAQALRYNYNNYVGKFVRVDGTDSLGVVTSITPIDGTGTLPQVTVFKDGVIRAGGTTLSYDDTTKFIYIDLVMDDGDEFNSVIDDSLLYASSGIFKPECFFKPLTVDDVPAYGVDLMRNATHTYSSIQALLRQRPGTTVADSIYVLRVCW